MKTAPAATFPIRSGEPIHESSSPDLKLAASPTATGRSLIMSLGTGSPSIRFFRNCSSHDNGQNAVAKVTARLCRAERLSKFTLRHPRVYFTLAADRSAEPRLAHQSRTTSGTPSSANRVRRAGLRDPRRSSTSPIGTVGASTALVLGSSPETLDSPHCLDESRGHPVLELIRVDLGGKPDHVARKCDADIQVRRRASQFEALRPPRLLPARRGNRHAREGGRHSGGHRPTRVARWSSNPSGRDTRPVTPYSEFQQWPVTSTTSKLAIRCS